MSVLGWREPISQIRHYLLINTVQIVVSVNGFSSIDVEHID